MAADTGSETSAPPVRQQEFECACPVEILVEQSAGRLDARLTGADGDDADACGLTVRVRADDSPRAPWFGGLTGLLTWLGEQADPGAAVDTAAEAVRRTRIEFDGRRLLVRAPKETPLRAVPLLISITAPTASSVSARAGAADVTVDGAAARVDASTGSGDVRVQRCDGPVDLRTGSGNARLGSVLGPLRAHHGSGDLDVMALPAGGRVQAGSGNVRLGTVGDDLAARTGSGDLTVADAESGECELVTGSGQLHLGVHARVLAEVDLRTGSGTARSDLPVGPQSDGAHGPALRVRGRTGSGDALITSASG